MSFRLQDVSRILLLSPMGSIGFIVADQSPLVQKQLTVHFKTERATEVRGK
jgi:hypothetical protein